jgi:hypothetical protein
MAYYASEGFRPGPPRGPGEWMPDHDRARPHRATFAPNWSFSSARYAALQPRRAGIIGEGGGPLPGAGPSDPASYVPDERSGAGHGPAAPPAMPFTPAGDLPAVRSLLVEKGSGYFSALADSEWGAMLLETIAFLGGLSALLLAIFAVRYSAALAFGAISLAAPAASGLPVLEQRD